MESRHKVGQLKISPASGSRYPPNRQARVLVDHYKIHIQHRLFSHITMNWRGRPLTSHEVMQSIAAATSRSGLTVHSELDSGEYPTGVRVSGNEIAALPITRHRLHGDWNYTLHHQRPVDAATTGSTPDEALADRLTSRGVHSRTQATGAHER